jgi:hypothetical protein
MSYNRRYYITRMVRKAGMQVITKARTINLRSDQTQEAKDTKYVAELSTKYNYAVQFINPMMTL